MRLNPSCILTSNPSLVNHLLEHSILVARKVTIWASNIPRVLHGEVSSLPEEHFANLAVTVPPSQQMRLLHHSMGHEICIEPHPHYSATCSVQTFRPGSCINLQRCQGLSQMEMRRGNWTNMLPPQMTPAILSEVVSLRRPHARRGKRWMLASPPLQQERVPPHARLL